MPPKSNGDGSVSAKNSSGASKNKKKSSGGGSKNVKGKNQTEELSDDAGDKPPLKRLKISYGRD